MTGVRVHGAFFEAWCFGIPKQGTADAGSEDAANVDIAGRFAVADGATESTYSRQWAMLLTVEYVENGPSSLQDLEHLTETWKRQIGVTPPKSWYVEQKLMEGAFAAFCGLSCDRDGTWAAVALGDSCLFWLRGHTLLTSFPAASTADLKQAPTLLGTGGSPDILAEQLQSKGGKWSPGDTFLLATDALSRFLFARHEEGGNVLAYVDGLETSEQFAMWVETLRKSNQIQNDDTTLVVVKLCSDVARR